MVDSKVVTSAAVLQLAWAYVAVRHQKLSLHQHPMAGSSDLETSVGWEASPDEISWTGTDDHVRLRSNGYLAANTAAASR